MASKKDKEHHYDEFDDVIMMKRIGQMASNMVKKNLQIPCLSWYAKA